MHNAHARILASVGQEQFQQQVVQRFGLLLTDASVTAAAEDLGWSTTFLHSAKNRAARKAPPSGDLSTIFGKAKAAAPVSVSPPQAAVSKCVYVFLLIVNGSSANEENCLY